MASSNRSGHRAVGVSYHPPATRCYCPFCAPPPPRCTCTFCTPPARRCSCRFCNPPAPARDYVVAGIEGLAIGSVGAAAIMSGDGGYLPAPFYGGYQKRSLITGIVATGIELAAAMAGN